MTNLKKKISDGDTILGTWNTMGSTMSTKVIASSGLDFQILDLEHGPFVIDSVHDHVASSYSYNCSCLVRVPSNIDWMILQVLDQGAEGIVVPQVGNIEEVERMIDTTMYPPVGSRGFSTFTFTGGFSNKDTQQYVDKANENLVKVILLESPEAIEILPEILKKDEVDVVYIGAYDLSKHLGVPGDIYNKKVVDLVKKSSELVDKHKAILGSFVPQNEETLKFCLDIGLKFITYGVDSFQLKNSYESAVNVVESY